MSQKEDHNIIYALREAVAINEGPVSYMDILRRYRGSLSLTSVERELRRLCKEDKRVIRLDNGLYTHKSLGGLNNMRRFI